MKRTLFGAGAIVLLFAGTLFWGPASDAIYNAAYAPPRDRLAVVVTVAPALKQRLAHPTPSGSISGKDDGFSWASVHSEETGAYYFRFENLGGRSVYARSRLFTKLIGNTRLQLAPKQIIYLRLIDPGPSTWLTASVDASERDSLLASTGTGTAMTLVMPSSLK